MITLFTAKTGNGYRVSILLEELGLPYETVVTDIRVDAERTPRFLAVSPLGKIPAILDPDTVDGAPVALAESLAIALYLTEKTGKLMPQSLAERARAWQWAAIVASGFGAAIPGIFFGRLLGETEHAKLIAKYYDDIDRYFGAMDAHLATHAFLAGERYSFADCLAAPLLPTAKAFGVDLDQFPSLNLWGEQVFERPAVRRGMAAPA
jgi:GSH-dependent disulfide-bond oxidoreductase